jgi:hypothetical protein
VDSALAAIEKDAPLSRILKPRCPPIQMHDTLIERTCMYERI